MKLQQLVDELSAFLLAQADGKTFIFGISGGQGAGKSTLCAALAEKLAAQNKSALVLALDDFYLPKESRQKLAEDVHPLCATRGVPGTHEVERLAQVLARLTDPGDSAPVELPRFSKSHDDRIEPATLTARPDFIFLEGWCVGGHADCITAAPQNQWEHEHDPHGTWKSWSHKAAAAYQPIWARCDAMMLLRQENFDAVIDARWLQEQGNAAKSGVWQFKSRDEVAAFCAHYQSWTLGIWKDLTQRADFAIGRDAAYDYYPLRG